jgi:hypothetical protein
MFSSSTADEFSGGLSEGFSLAASTTASTLTGTSGLLPDMLELLPRREVLVLRTSFSFSFPAAARAAAYPRYTYVPDGRARTDDQNVFDMYDSGPDLSSKSVQVWQYGGAATHVSSRPVSPSSKMTPRPIPNLAGRAYFSFSSAAAPRLTAVASSSLYDGCHGRISLRVNSGKPHTLTDTPFQSPLPDPTSTASYRP